MRTREVKGWGQLPRSLAKVLAGKKFKNYEWKLLWAVVYKTIAFNKLEDKIPQSQLVALTGIDKRHMNRTVNSLIKKGVIFRRGNIYGVEPDFYKWEKSPLQVTNEKVTSTGGKVTSTGDKKSPHEADSRDLSKRAFQERALSASQKEKEREIFLERIRKSKELLKKILEEKKEL